MACDPTCVPPTSFFVVWESSSPGTRHCVAEIQRAGKWRDDMVLS